MRNPRIVTNLVVLLLAGLFFADLDAQSSTDAQKLAALADALKSGVLTRQEYDAKVAQIKGPNIDPKKKAALDDARKAGVLTQQEYDAKLQALKNGAPAAATPPAPTPSAVVPPAGRAPIQAAAPAPSSAKKTISVADPMFKIPAYTVTLPGDWSFEGVMLPGSCGNDLPVVAFRAFSPDKLTGVQMIPRVDWYSAADTRAYQMAGISPCNLHAPAHAADVAGQIAASLRPNAQIAGTAPTPPDTAAEFKNNIDTSNTRLLAASASTPGYVTKISGDQQRVRVRYDFEGHAVEEWLAVSIIVADQPVTVINTGRGGIIQPGIARLMHSTVNVSSMRAPAGKLDAAENSLREILKSVKLVPEYAQAYSDFQQRNFDKVMASIKRMGSEALARGERDGAALQRQNDQFHAWQAESREKNRQNFERDMQRKDGASKDFLDYVSNQTYYLDPVHGATVTIQNEPGVNGYVTQNSWGSWTELVPIHH